MATPQLFKGDAEELKYLNAGSPIAGQLSQQKTDFFDGAYACAVLGDLLWNSGRAPLSNAIPRTIFRDSFSSLFDSFERAGSFESYLSVFRQVFGEEVEVEFVVPGPGKLQINIESAGVVLSRWVTRKIVDNAYEFAQAVDQEGNFIVFQTVKGFKSQYELIQMLFEMVPAGIYTDINLSVGA